MWRWWRIKRYRSIVGSFIAVLPILSRFMAMLLCSVYVYAYIGVLAFGGSVNASNTLLDGTAYKESGYMSFSFNDMPSALATLLNVALLNNWIVFTEGLAAASGGGWITRLYFVFFVYFFVYGLLNLVTAFVLDTAIHVQSTGPPGDGASADHAAARSLSFDRAESSRRGIDDGKAPAQAQYARMTSSVFVSVLADEVKQARQELEEHELDEPADVWAARDSASDII